MDISINNTNFKGAFFINTKNMSPKMKSMLMGAVGEHKKIVFNDFGNKEGYNLYILKNSKDYNFANFIEENKIRFKYMPEVDTKLQFEPSRPEDVVEYLKNNPQNVITKISDLIEYVNKNRFTNRERKDSHISNLKKLLNSLHINIEGTAAKDARGVTKIVDNANHKLVLISPFSKNDVRYLLYENPHEKTLHYAIDKEGNIIAKYNTPDGIIKFKEAFKNAIRTQGQ